jgi:hypothetical protein
MQRCVRVVLGSNVGRDTGYPDSSFSWFSSAYLCEFCHNRFRVLPNSSATSLLTIRRRIVKLLTAS